jgi:hypothetical protein
MMSSLDQRILYFRAATSAWTDYTIALNTPDNGQTVALNMAAGDFLYISSFLPFNHKFLKFTTPSVSAVTPIIEVSDAAVWSPVADMLDHTGGMKQSGNLVFTRDRDKLWGRIGNNRRDMPVMATAPTQIYDSFWMRISFASPVSFTLSYVGQCFTNDTDLFAEYPALRPSGLMSGWKTGKVDWNDQHILAASYIAKVLRQRGIIDHRDQLLDLSSLSSPSVHKTAQIIYSGLGAKNYESEIRHAQAAFEAAMTMKNFDVDSDKDGRKGLSDRRVTTQRATR